MNPKNTFNKTALALSGGVDSAVSAHLLKEQGHDVCAVYLECWRQEGCRAEQDRQDALRVALQLDIPFQVLDFKKAYQEKVMGYFLSEHQVGRTPNPDILCNSVIKFGLFYDWALQQGFEKIATGHYAQIAESDSGNSPSSNNLHLATGLDLHKDQTYFLHQMRKEQLQHIVFPVGHLHKKKVRQLARDARLPVAEKKDSVGICFVGEINVTEYLREQLGESRGEIVTAAGQVVGQHQGLWFYTIGQRHGFTIDIKKAQQHTNWHQAGEGLPPLYVIGKIPEKNRLVVGLKQQTTSSRFTVKNLHQIDQGIDLTKLPLKVRIRHTGELHDCSVETQTDKILVKTNQPVEGVAQGQFAVIYTESAALGPLTPEAQYICLGGGVIEADKGE